jgi:hypothetical protein
MTIFVQGAQEAIKARRSVNTVAGTELERTFLIAVPKDIAALTTVKDEVGNFAIEIGIGVVAARWSLVRHQDDGVGLMYQGVVPTVRTLSYWKFHKTDYSFSVGH